MNLEINYKKLGLPAKEAKIYLVLTNLHESDAAQIAKLTNLKRSTCYLYLSNLKEKGLVSTSFSGKKTIFIAENPYKLLTLAEEKRQQAQKQEEEILAIIPEIKKLAKQNPQEIKIKYFEGVESMWTLLDEAAKSKNTQYGIGSFGKILEVFGSEKFTAQYSDKRKKTGSKAYIITDYFRQPKRDYFNDTTFREIKYLPEKLQTTSTIWLYENKLIILELSKPYTATLIESTQLAKLFKFMFNVIWKNL